MTRFSFLRNLLQPYIFPNQTVIQLQLLIDASIFLLFVFFYQQKYLHYKKNLKFNVTTYI